MGEINFNMNVHEKEEQILKFREKVLKAESERLQGDQTISIAEARQKLLLRIKK